MDGEILGTYLRCASLLRWAALAAPLERDHGERRNQMLDQLVDVVEYSLDGGRLLGVPQSPPARTRTERRTS
jgi:hypothetical protein